MTVNTLATDTVTAARSRACPLCGTPAAEPCQPKPAGDHLARYLDAHTAGMLTRAYMTKVLGEMVVIHAGVVVTVLDTLLAEGHVIDYAQDAVWSGWFADLRDSDGRLVETGLGATKAEAAEHLTKRLAGER